MTSKDFISFHGLIILMAFIGTLIYLFNSMWLEATWPVATGMLSFNTMQWRRNAGIWREHCELWKELVDRKDRRKLNIEHIATNN